MDTLLTDYNVFLVERNKNINLTGHKSFDESFKFNIKDSLIFNEKLVSYFEKNTRVVDIGSGGGCPAIPLKISFPHIQMTMVDSVRKKTDFLNDTILHLGLEDIVAIHTRIEDFCIVHREKFNIVTARAVAPLSTLLEYALPLVQVGGYILAFKGKGANDEVRNSKNALRILGAEIVDTLTENLDQETVRSLIVVKKVETTPIKYPRQKNLPRIQPL